MKKRELVPRSPEPAAGATLPPPAFAPALLDDIGRLYRVDSLEELAQLGLERAAAVLGARRAVLVLGGAGLLDHQARYTFPPSWRPAWRRSDGRPARETPLILRSDVRPSAVPARLRPLLAGGRVRGFALLPLREAGSVIGELVALSPRADAFGAERVAMAELFLGHLTNAVLLLVDRELVHRRLGFFRSLVDRCPSLTLTLSPRGVIRYASPAVRQNLGYSADEVRGRTIFELVHSQDLGRLAAPDSEDREPIDWREPIRLRHKNGTWVYLESLGRSLAAEPEAAEVVLQVRDVTSRVALEQLQSAALLIRDFSREVASLRELQAMVFDLVSELLPRGRLAVSLYELAAPGGALVDRFRDRPAPARPRRGLPQYVLRTGAPLFANARKIADLEERGEIHVVHPPAFWIGLPLTARGVPLGVFAVSGRGAEVRLTRRQREVLQLIAGQLTLAFESRRAGEELRKSEEQFRALFRQSNDAILICDDSGIGLDANERARALFGYGEEELLAMRPEDLFAPQVHARSGGRTCREILSRGLEHAELECRKRSGEVFPAEVSAKTFLLDAHQICQIVVRDVTERKRAEEETLRLQESLRRGELMYSLGALVGGVAHEVRNPLFGISASLDAFVASFGEREEYLEYIDIFRSQVHRLSELMNSLLEFGKPGKGEASPDRIEEVVAESAALCLRLGDDHHVAVQPRLPAGLPAVPMDRGRLVQVFGNLLANAIQHSPRGGVVTVEARQVKKEGDPWVVCTVEDSGPGFRPEDLARLFEPFFSRRRGGTGLGLSIVQRIVEDHGGRIAAGNRPAGGAILTVELPALPVTRAAVSGAS